MPSPFEPILVLREAARLLEGGGVRFTVLLDGLARDAFAVRWRERVFAYLNSCRHQSLPLDFGDAHFFDEAYDALVCCHHGARYDPASGACLGGPCAGGRLRSLAIEERDGALWCVGAVRRDAASEV
jgi:nitrite reductase/ring-hydroxylating ferredoxin subunit